MMSAWASIGPGTRALILAFGGVALAGTGYLVWQAAQPVETTLTAEDAGNAVATQPTEAAPLAEAVQEPSVPKIDTWRVAPDGEALVAGLALPGAAVQVIVDDRPVAKGVALASGEFVLQFTLPANPAPSLLWLSMTAPGGTPVASPEMVAIAPIAGPELAVAEPEPQPETGAEASDEPVAATEAEIAADTAPATLLVTEEGAAVLPGAAQDPALVDTVIIETISYSPEGAVLVGGRGEAGAGLRLYLENAEVAVATVAADGLWQLTLGDTAPGIYTLRVDQIDAAGKVTARFETPFKRETLETLARISGAEAEADPDTAQATASAAPSAPVKADAVALAASDQTENEAAPTEAAPVSTVAPAGTEPIVPAGAAPPVTITVQPGFTLWGIAQERFGDGVFYVQVFEANRDQIRDPNLIYPGQVFSIPETLSP